MIAITGATGVDIAVKVLQILKKKDIKTELIRPVDEIFTTNDTYTVIDFSRKRIYQGIIASKPLNPIFLKLIKKFFEYDRKGRINQVRYQVFIRDFYRKIKSDCNGIKEGLNINKSDPNFNYFFGFHHFFATIPA